MARLFTRRSFVQHSVIAGVSVSIVPLAAVSRAALREAQRLRPISWDPERSAPRARVDGIAKVTGEKLFARDFRARDLDGWPPAQAHARVLRAGCCDRVYLGPELAALGAELQPDRVVRAEDLTRDGISLPEFYGDDMLLPEGRAPSYLGQPVAIAIWRDFPRFRAASQRLRELGDAALRYGAAAPARGRAPWGAVRIVRVAAPDPLADDVHSALQHGMLFPDGFDGARPRWPEPDAQGDPRARAMHHARAIERTLARADRAQQVLEREYFSQSTDVAALEPDNGNGWYDAERRTVHLLVASQSPHEVAAEAAALLARCALDVSEIRLHPCYTVGYGSKDHHVLPFYALVSALYGDGQPVRLAQDRYEQFQGGLKRHAFGMRYRIAAERESGRFRALRAELTADGGGRANFSASVALVAATAAHSIYSFPLSDVQSRALASRAVEAGSARGYGTLQSMTAMEMLVDELAEELGLDAIELRRRNVLRSGMKNTQGAIPAGAQRADELLARAQEHALWLERAERKTRYERAHPGWHYGVGFACVHKDFGTGAEAAFAGVELSREGRIALRHIAVEIGTGSSTAQAALCARWLGRPADEVHTAQTEWPELPLRSHGNPWTLAQAEQDRAERDPLWTPFLATPTSASNSAFFYGHATQQAARMIFERGLWPAALSIWGAGSGGGQAAPIALRARDARWVSGMLTAAGMEPLSLERLSERAHALGGVTGAVVHSFNRWEWAEAEFALTDSVVRLPIDGLALAYGSGEPGADAAPPGSAQRVTPQRYQVVPRRRVFYPTAARNGAGTTYYSAAGTLVELAVEHDSGRVQLLSHHTILECGTPIVRELISGQIQGGVAMGIGHALHESLPLYEDGPGSGAWNFDRYRLPRARDVAPWTQTSECLPPLSETDPPKGMAEVTMIPVVAAIANGVAHAIGQRIRTLPLNPSRIREALA